MHLKNRQQFGVSLHSCMVAALVMSSAFVCYPLLCCSGRTENVRREKREREGKLEYKFNAVRLSIHWLKFLISSQLIFKDPKIQTLVLGEYGPEF
ncbi:hypothetical protein NXF25_020796 [Crotalus adamanteus]|uniref:Secreted protein n=1 Tax=Crotalus adamanteus TaxID=8729 RepID=A0AAW1B682_CROAD